MTVLVNPESLRESGSRIGEIVSDVREGGVRSVCGGAGEYGHDELFGAVEEFCSAVLTGNEALKGNVEYIGTALAESAKKYEDSDEPASAELALRARTHGEPMTAESGKSEEPKELVPGVGETGSKSFRPSQEGRAVCDGARRPRKDRRR